MLAAVLDYAARGWSACPGAHPTPVGSRACSCDRVGCPAPGAHPTSPSWSRRATADAEVLRQRWAADPDANVVLPTGHLFDVFDVPAAAGVMALARMDEAGMPVGPVAAHGVDRYFFFVATRGAPDDEDEWWPCDLDARPTAVPSAYGLRWHCRDSYVVAPPSALASGDRAGWVRYPDTQPLPDPLVLLESLAEACEEYERTSPAPDGTFPRH